MSNIELDKNKNILKWYEKSSYIILFLVLFFPLGIFLMWRYANWSRQVKIGITAFFCGCLFTSLASNRLKPTNSSDITSQVQNVNNNSYNKETEKKLTSLDTYRNEYIELKYNSYLITNIPINVENSEFSMVSKLIADDFSNFSGITKFTSVGIFVNNSLGKEIYNAYQLNYKMTLTTWFNGFFQITELTESDIKGTNLTRGCLKTKSCTKKQEIVK